MDATSPAERQTDRPADRQTDRPLVFSAQVNADLSLSQLRGGLTYGTDAYLLAAFARPRPKERAVELGGGSGIVSLLCERHNKFASVAAVEIQEPCARLIAENARANALDDRVLAKHADLRDLRSADFGGEVGAVFANPPYMKVGCGKRNETDEKYIARHEVCGDISDFCACAGRLLKTGGYFTVVWRPDRLSDLMAALRANRLEPKRMTFVHADTETAPSMVLIEAAKDAAPGLAVSAPLILFRDGPEVTPRVPTEALDAVYRECRLGY